MVASLAGQLEVNTAWIMIARLNGDAVQAGFCFSQPEERNSKGGWDQVNNKVKRKLDSLFVSCEEAHELRDIKEAVLAHFDWLEPGVVAGAIGSRFARVSAPGHRDVFILCPKKEPGLE